MNEQLLKTSSTDVSSSRKKLRKTLVGAGGGASATGCTSEGSELQYLLGVYIGYETLEGSVRTLFGGSLSFENFPSIDFRVWITLNERQPFLITIPFSPCASRARCHGNTIKSWEVQAVNCASHCYHNRPFAIVDHVINFCENGKFC